MLIHIVKREFTTSLTPSRVVEEIRDRLPSGFWKNDSEFRGYVTEKSFKIRKNLHYNKPASVIVRNSFAPVAVGKAIENEFGTAVKLKLRMNFSISAFIFFIEAAMMLGMLLGAMQCVLGEFVEGLQSIGTFLPIILGIELLMLFAFRYPAKRMIERLEEILLY